MASEIVDQSERPRPQGPSPFSKPPGGMVVSKPPEDRVVSSLRETDERRLLRELSIDNNIRKTSSLVAVYNRESSEHQRTALYKWLRLYGEKTEKSLHPEAVLDYAEISRIVPKTREDEELLRTLLVNISSRFKPDQFVETNTGKALYETLLNMPPVVFEDTTQLLSLTEKLLSSLARRPILNRSSFKDHKSTFFSLRFILGYLETFSQPRLSRVKKQEFRQLVVEKRRELGSSFKYYPVHFHFMIIEKSIERLTATDDSSLRRRSLRQSIAEAFGMHQMIQKLMPSMSSMDLRELTPKNAVEKIKAGSTAGIQEEHWLYLIQKLADAGMKALQRAEDMESFTDWCNAIIEIQHDLKGEEEQKALRFGIIYELRQLSIGAHATDVRKRAAKMLTDLCVTRATDESWAEDEDLFDLLFKSIYRVHVRCVLREETEAALRHLHGNRTAASDKTLDRWLRFGTFEEKLKIQRESRPRSYWNKELSITLGEMIGYIPLEEVYRGLRDLVKAYNQYDFTKAPSLVNNGACRHVKDMEFSIVAYDNPDNEKLVEWSMEAGSGYDPVNAQFTWAHDTRKRINPEYLFRLREACESGPRAAVIRKVLIYGNSGSGKTCLSRMLAYNWTQGGFMREFKTMYVLPVRKLCSVDEGGRGSLTLEEAIADICYSDRRDPISQSLRTQIHDNLNSQRTLLVLDGIDKADELASGIITHAKECRCKILLFSASYGLRGELLFADRVVECLGMDDEQVKTFASSELSTSSFNEFMKYFKSNPELWTLMHIPVMAYILSLFWADNEETLVHEKRRKSVFSLYTKIVNMLWSRFSRRPRMDRVLREDVLRRIDVIAFRAVQKDQRLIDRSLFEEQASTGVVMGMLRDSGYVFFDMEKDKYYFPNRTFQEYFAGRYIAYRLRKGTSRERQESADFLTKRKYERKSRMIVALTAQALADWRGTVVVREVFSSIDRSPVEILGVQHFFLKLQILDEWAAGLVDSSVDDDWIGGTASQVMDALVHVLMQLEPSTRLWNLVMDKLDQYRDLISGFSTVLDTFTETQRTEDLIGTHIFEDVVKLAKHAPRHLTTLVGMARAKLSDRSPRIRKQALDMIQDLMTHVPKLSAELFSMLDVRYTDLDEDVRQRIIMVVGNIAKKAPRYAVKLMSILKRGCVDADQGVRIMAMLSSEAFLSRSPKLLNEFLPLLERGISDPEEGVRVVATLMIGRVLMANPSLLSDVMPLIELACGNVHEDVREKAMEVVGKIVEAEPSCAAFLMPMLERGTEDESEDVGRAAKDAKETVQTAARQIPDGYLASNDVWQDTRRGAYRTEEDINRHASIAGPSSSSGAFGEANDNGDMDAKTEDDDIIRDTFRDLISKVITGEYPESTRHLVELLFEFPVTIEETIHNDEVNIVLHAKTSESLGAYKRDEAHSLVSHVESCFEDEYPGILELIRSA